MAEIVMTILEIIGTIAFAISGALIAIGASLDIFGVVFISCTTAVGGGILRDLIVGKTPPAIFENFSICLIAIIVSIIVFVIAYTRKNFISMRTKIEHINNFFDAIGLAAFSLMGAEVAYIHGYSDNAFIVIFLGLITGVGGGIFRDILTDTTPYVLKKHVYALASIMGCLVYYLLRLYSNDTILASVISMILVVTIRILATKFRWSLPKIDLERK